MSLQRLETIGRKIIRVQTVSRDTINSKLLLKTLVAFKNGDFSVRLPGEWTGEAGKIADTLNDIIELRLEGAFGGNQLSIWHQPDGAPKPVRAKLMAESYHSTQGDLLTVLRKYYARHEVAKARSAAEQAT